MAVNNCMNAVGGPFAWKDNSGYGHMCEGLAHKAWEFLSKALESRPEYVGPGQDQCLQPICNHMV